MSVDNPGVVVGPTTQTQPVRVKGTVYTNGATPRIVTVSLIVPIGQTPALYCDNIDGQTTAVASWIASSIAAGDAVTIVVLPGYKYSLLGAATCTVNYWTEWQ